jgi:hypothetical protein
MLMVNDSHSFSREGLDIIGESVDRLISLDVSGRGIIGTLYEVARRKSAKPLCLMAAESLRDRLHPGDFVLIACGMLVYPLMLPETDGPLGGAALARSLQLGLGAKPILITDCAAVDMTKAVCRGAGLNVADLEVVKTMERTVGVVGFPVDDKEAEAQADSLFRMFSPQAVMSVECRGRNEKGVYHALPTGRNMNHIAAKLPHLFTRAEKEKVLTIGIGDGGNEIGWGPVSAEIGGKLRPKTCSCGCGGGIADVTPVDVLIAAAVSNWGAYGVCACLAALLNEPAILHDVRTESRMLRECVDAGAVNGPSFLAELKVDGVSEDTNLAILRVLSEIIAAPFGYPDFAS